MKKIRNIKKLFILFLAFTTIFGLPNTLKPTKVNAATIYCSYWNGQHKPDTSFNMGIIIVKVKINGTFYNASLYTCLCGEQVIMCDYSYPTYFSPQTATLEHSYGYPAFPGSYTYYVPNMNYFYYGKPVDWKNVY